MVQLRSATAVREALAEQGVYNPFIKVPKGSFIISFSADQFAHYGRAAHWSAHRWGFKNDPEGSIGDGGTKSFRVYNHNERVTQLAAAIAWMTGRYPDAVDFVKDPWGSYQPRAQLVAFLAKFDIVWTALNTRKKA
jgi:hypothetical protein